MPHYIIFERSLGHCFTYLYQAPSLREALTNYAIREIGAELMPDGTLMVGEVVYQHSLALIESERKSSDKFDELQWDDKAERLLNGSSWEVRELPTEAWEAESAAVFCSAEPWSLADYIALCRARFREQHPRSRARAFVWYLEDGPLVTFHRRQHKACAVPIEVVGRYIIPWQKERWPLPYALTSEMVQDWVGDYDDLLAQLKVKYPF